MEKTPKETRKITRALAKNKKQDYLQLGTKLEGRYLIEGILGRGGMGAVYSARDMRFTAKKIVAVKEMINQATDEEKSKIIIKNFEREANILATVNHPAVPTIYDYFTLGSRSYLVMKYIKGENLEVFLKTQKGFLTENQVITWAIDLCGLLHYLHTHDPEPIIFRDIKPANILIQGNGQISLVDFGIARTFQIGEKGTMIGTEGYSPPEQYRGKASPLVDIYALGATLHHILTKRDPRSEPPFTFSERPIRQINPKVSPELEAVINTALEYNPEDRFESAKAMKDALISAARQTGILSNNNFNLETGIYLEKAHELLWIFKCEDEVRGTPLFHKGIIYIGAYDHNMYALEASTGDFKWKYATEGGIASKPAIHENNLYFGSSDQRVYAISILGGKSVWTQSTDGPIYSSPYIAEGHVFIGSDDEHLYTINALTGRQAWRVHVNSMVRSSPLVVGERVYFGAEDGEIHCTDLSGKSLWHFTTKRAVTASPHFFNGVIYISSLDSILYAIEANTGWVIWRFRMNKGSISTPTTNKNHIFVGSSDGNMYCINMQTSNKEWSFSTDNQINGSPVLYKDSIYFGCVDGKIYCLDAKNGRLRWEYATDGPITGTPILNDDVVYIGSTDYHIYALPA